MAGVVSLIAWGALAFGAVYPWAYVPLVIGCAALGIIALIIERRSGPPIVGLAAGLSAIAIAVALQIVPLGASTVARISPAADTFLRNFDLSYRLARTQGESPAATAPAALTHTLSIEPDKTMLGLALFLGFAVFLPGMVRLVSARGASPIARSLVVVGMVMALIGIGQATLLINKDGVVTKIYGFWKPQMGGNPFGPFVNHNHFAGWTIMVLPLAIGGACAAWERATRFSRVDARDLAWLSNRSAAGVLLMMLAAAVMALALFMTQSRSGMAAFAVAILIFAWVLTSRQATSKGRMLAAVLIAGLFVGATSWAGVGRIANRLSATPGDVVTPGGRLQTWSDAIYIIRDFAFTGAGLDTFGTAMMVYQSSERYLHYQEAHNDYLQIAAEGGLLVGIPVLVTLAIFVRNVRRRFREAPKEGTTYWLRVGAVVGLVSVGLQSLVEFSLQMPGNAVLFVLVAAIALHQSPNLRMKHTEPSSARTGA
jgi:O-antigen ligase/polysaccharide polymerase Wzy-like membrane protein